MPNLSIFVCSTRQQRLGGAVAEWFADRARQHGGFDVSVVDLMHDPLPLLDEPVHPAKRQYHHEHTKRWSATVASADAFVFVTPEYNHGPAPALLNALDYLVHEWAYKPVAFVSYGGVSGGSRSPEVIKAMLTGLRMMPIPEAVNLPFFSKHLKEGKFEPEAPSVEAVKPMLDELGRWTTALATLRQK